VEAHNGITSRISHLKTLETKRMSGESHSVIMADTRDYQDTALVAQTGASTTTRQQLQILPSTTTVVHRNQSEREGSSILPPTASLAGLSINSHLGQSETQNARQRYLSHQINPQQEPTVVYDPWKHNITRNRWQQNVNCPSQSLETTNYDTRPDNQTLFDSALVAHEYLKSTSSWVSENHGDYDDKENEQNAFVPRVPSDGDLVSANNNNNNNNNSDENEFGLLSPSPAFSQDE